MDVPDNHEPGKWLAACQALFIVLLFLFLLAWSLNWKLRPPPPPPLSLAVFELPTPEPSEPQETEKTEVQPPKEDNKLAEIALEKKRKEEERKDKERADKKKREEDRKKREKRKEEEREDKERADKKKREEDRKKREKRKEEEREDKERADKKKREEDRKKREKRKEEEREASRLTAQRAEADAEAAKLARTARLASLQETYIARIIERIQSHLTTPKSVPKDESIIVVIRLQLTPDGELVDLPKIEESSGHAEYDENAIRAILIATPIPMPKEPELIKEFQDMVLYISPENF